MYRRYSYVLYAAAFVSSLAPDAFAQAGPSGEAAHPMDAALNHKNTIAAGAVAHPMRKSPKPYNQSPVFPAVTSQDPGLQGSFDLKTARTPQGPIDAAAAVVNMGSHPSYLELTDAPRLRDGAPLFAQANSQTAQATIDPRAYFTYPLDGATLALTQSFIWSTGYQAQGYWIYVGSCQDCTDILDQNMGLNRSVTVYLPNDGRVIYVTLFTFYAGNWYWADYQFRAPSPQPQPAQMISPANGSTLSATQTFTWTTGTYVDQYSLWIGSCQDCHDLLYENEGHNTTRTLSLPTDGRTIYVSLYSSIGGKWYWFDYQYRAVYSKLYTPHVVVTNNLDYPINILVNGTVIGSVAARNTQYANVTVSSLSVSFQLVRPTLNGNPLGDPMNGVFPTIYNPSGSYSFTVGTLIGQQYYFAPLITNRSSVAVEIEVNGGLQAENRCNCVANVGSTNVATGYYRLYSNGNVRLYFNGSNYTGAYWYWGTDNGKVAAGGALPGYVDGYGRAYFVLTNLP
jgi:hypothetical protein